MTDNIMTDNIMTDAIMTDAIMTDNIMTDNIMTDDIELTSIDSDISEYNELQTLIHTCDTILNIITDSDNTLQTINTHIKSQNAITVTYQDWTGDFSELLNSLHTSAINDINEYREHNFTHTLLNVIDSAVFYI